jgi:hypothetical protein
MVANRHRAGAGVLVMAGRHARRASTTEFVRTSRLSRAIRRPNYRLSDIGTEESIVLTN